MPIPKSMKRCDRGDALECKLKHVKKPDIDNLVKLYLDCLTGIAIHDDNAVSLGSCIKVYSPNPKVEIYIEETGRLLTLNELYEGTWPTVK